MHRQGPQVNERKLLAIAEVQLHIVHRRTALKTPNHVIKLDVIQSHGKQLCQMLVVSHFLLHPDVHGAPSSFQDIANSLARAGHEEYPRIRYHEVAQQVVGKEHDVTRQIVLSHVSEKYDEYLF
jgi:hypothetical protein